MTLPQRPKDDRLDELLMEAALYGLQESQANELAARGGAQDPSYELAAAALDLATLRVERMPASLEARLLSRASKGAAAPATAAVATVTPIRRRDPTRWSGWLAAAAMLALFALSLVWKGHLPSVASRTPAEARAALLSSAKDARVIAWTATKDAAAEHASGDVVWSEAEQKGFMRFHGLAPNDKSKSEYQLWIFDKAQDYPVDGGVFDVGPEGEVVVAIHSKLHVDDPTLFAVTVEKPGGVVVSKRERIVVTAAVQGA